MKYTNVYTSASKPPKDVINPRSFPHDLNYLYLQKITLTKYIVELLQ